MKPTQKIAVAACCAAAALAMTAGAQDAKPEKADKADKAEKIEKSDSAVVARIGTAEVEKYMDKTVVVTGKVAQVTIREKLVYLNLDKAYPESHFTAVVFSRATNQFGDLAGLKDKNVEVQGKVEDYRGRPQIVLNSTNQLKVVEAGAGSAASK